MFIVITLALFLILSIALGITVLRQSKAIWKMESRNACTINNTLNTFTCIEPILIIIVVVALIFAAFTTRLGF